MTKYLEIISFILLIVVACQCQIRHKTPSDLPVTYDLTWEQAVRTAKDSVEFRTGGPLPPKVLADYESMCFETLTCFMRFRIMPSREALIEGLVTYLDSALLTEESRAERETSR